MHTSDPRWRKFWQNLIWYVATIILLILVLRFLRWMGPVVLPVLWVTALSWGGLLAYQFSQLFLRSDAISVSEERARAYLEQARDYQVKIERLINATTNVGNQLHRERLAQQVEDWIRTIEALVQRVGSMREDHVIRRDLQAVPQALKDLETRLATETDPTVRRQLERTLANRQKQQEALQELQTAVKRAEIQVESTLSQLGTIYSQLLTGQSTSDTAVYNRLSTEIDEEMGQLQDRLEALREVKLEGNEE
jgi:hypothetical protein